MKEVWKKSGITDWFEISNLGRARLAKDTDSFKHKAGYIMMRHINKFGYCVVRKTIGSKRHEWNLNRLVCEAFHGAPPTLKHHAAHIDGDKLNNTPENLYWATAKQNINDKHKHGTMVCGEKHHSSKLKTEDVKEIRAASGVRYSVLAEKYGVSEYTISDIRRNKSWKHIKTHA